MRVQDVLAYVDEIRKLQAELEAVTADRDDWQSRCGSTAESYAAVGRELKKVKAELDEWKRAYTILAAENASQTKATENHNAIVASLKKTAANIFSNLRESRHLCVELVAELEAEKKSNLALVADCNAWVRKAGSHKNTINRFERDYDLFEECSPPDVPRAKFVKWCFDAWEEKHDMETLAVMENLLEIRAYVAQCARNGNVPNYVSWALERTATAAGAMKEERQ